MVNMIKDYDTEKFENFNNSEHKENIEDFHKKRIAFIIWKNQVLLLKNSTLSHSQWAQSLGIDIKEFNSLTRGYVLNNDIVFYKGNFDFDEQVIEDAKYFSDAIKTECSLNFAKVYAGVNVGEVGTIYPPKKYLFDL